MTTKEQQDARVRQMIADGFFDNNYTPIPRLPTMPKPLQPDTSPQNVARVLRQAWERLADVDDRGPAGEGWQSDKLLILLGDLRALADALERQAGSLRGAMTNDEWNERVERAKSKYVAPWPPGIGFTEALSRAIRAAFPELAPQHAPAEGESDE